VSRKISESEAVDIAVRHARQLKIDGVFDGVYRGDGEDGRPYWRILFELNGVAPEARALYGTVGINVDALTGEPSAMENM